MRALRSFVPVLACAGTLITAGPAMGADIQTSPGLPDLDVRSGHIAPTAAQRAGAKALRAEVAWNQFGTPSTLVRSGGTLGTAGGATASDAARAWLDSNRSLFRLGSVDGLAVVDDAKLADSATHAVTLRQTPGGLAASGGGTVTIGVAKAGAQWRVISASSTLSGDETLAAGGARLSDGEAWQRAAGSVGRHTTLARITRLGSRKLGLARGWRGLHVAGLTDVQQTRKVAFPTISRGYIPAFETLVVDTTGTEPSAYRVYVDAQSRAVLAREGLVDNEGVTDGATAKAASAPKARAAQAAPTTTPFTGALPPQDGGCDTTKGPFTVTAGGGVRAIDVFANADTPANDIVLKLFQGTTEVAEADTLRTPERIRFSPANGVPAGDYFVQVCEFQDGGAPAEHDGRQQRSHRRVLDRRVGPVAQPVPSDERRPRLLVAVDERVVREGLQPPARRTAPRSRSARASTCRPR